MLTFKLTDEGNLQQWNITDEDRAKGSKIVTKGRWGDGSEEFPNVGQRYTYEILVYGNIDDIENKFPESAEPEEPGDPDANSTVPTDASTLIPDSILNDTIGALQGIGQSPAFAGASAALSGLKDKLGPASEPSAVKDASASLKELIKAAKQELGLS